MRPKPFRRALEIAVLATSPAISCGLSDVGNERRKSAG